MDKFTLKLMRLNNASFTCKQINKYLFTEQMLYLSRVGWTKKGGLHIGLNPKFKKQRKCL